MIVAVLVLVALVPELELEPCPEKLPVPERKAESLPVPVPVPERVLELGQRLAPGPAVLPEGGLLLLLRVPWCCRGVPVRGSVMRMPPRLRV
ncbi:hypothetical protein H9638_05305 [Arthrobacter sp. Sa2BUA2]|uniref:Secreted protein n=1 Tax=Arthrobacter pullicola TaxID=2762224 RepID=A0ABR8YGH6_9MICC|nr:hypothetical protein [Arthrobacter pullicola]MBD8043227.1 hypothetical protein [Arthrobacter pullicola]